MKTIYFIDSTCLDIQKSINEIMLYSAFDELSYLYSSIPIEMEDLSNIQIIEATDQLIDALVQADKAIFFAEYQPVIDIKLLNAFFSCKAKNLIWINNIGNASKFFRNLEGDKVLFVFPGPIVPLNLGSHQRAFNLLSNLSEAGYSVDVLIPEPKSRSIRERVEQSLGVISAKVYFYDNDYKVYPKPYRLFRKLEENWRLFQGKEKRLPDLFFERDYRRPTESCKSWVNSLYLENTYSSIIVSYAWMMASVQHVKHVKNLKIICDTHDVQYIRSSDFLNKKERLAYFSKLEREVEAKRLREADLVLAISESDQKLLKDFLGNESKVITTSAGFDYALRKVKKRPKDRPITFGFIGGSMAANVLSVEYILDHWWPKIRKISPDSKFLIAGSIGRNPRIIERSILDDSIEILGFVDNLDGFYHMIEVSLNPVIVQGGLNFKSVEAVFQGKHLLTNPLGAQCLSKSFKCNIIENEKDIEEFLDTFEFNLDLDYEFRVEAQNIAKRIFSNKNVMLDFLTANDPNLN